MARRPSGSRRQPGSRRSFRGGAGFVAAVVVIALIFVVALAVLRRPPARSAAGPAPVPRSVLTALTSVPMSTFNAVGSTDAMQPTLVPPVPATGKVQFLYVGAEYCPYCAAARWAMIVALSRFGTFSNLHLMRSSGQDVYPNTPTFTFYTSH